MYFNSYIFIFLFVPLTVGGYFFLNSKGRYRLSLAFVVGMSLWFYSYANLPLLFLILVSLCGNYFFSFCIEKASKRAEKKTGRIRLFGVLGILFNLGLLFYFKYYDFFVSNMNALFRQSWALKHIVLPMGISFYTFQQISFIVDRMWGKAEHYNVLDYAAFVTYFPQLVAGPIVQHSDLVPQFQDMSRKKFNWSSFTRGVSLFIMGLSKKVLLADILTLAADYGFDHVADLDTASAITVMLAYTFQLYFDFSGYSDMAIGLGWMMNIDLPMNFNTPYRSRSIHEFWQRWHITLNQFLVKYVYIPLGGSRKGKARKILNIVIVFILSGIWHGAAWTYILWGTTHGILSALEMIAEPALNKLEESKTGRFVRWMGAFTLISLSMVIFRSTSVPDVFLFFKQIFSFHWNGFLTNIAIAMDNAIIYIPLTLAKRVNEGWFYYVYPIYFGLMLLISAVLCSRKKGAYHRAKELDYHPRKFAVLAVLFAGCVISLSRVVVFLYLNF